MKTRGFTLIELLVVIAIIGLLSSVVLAAVNQARANARDAQRVQGLVQLRNALELYRLANGKYPVSCNTTTWGWENASGGGYTACPDDYVVGLAPTYIANLPAHPAGTTGGYIYTALGTNQPDFKILVSNVENYDANSSFKDPGSGGVSGSGCANPPRANTYSVYTYGARCQ